MWGKWGKDTEEHFQISDLISRLHGFTIHWDKKYKSRELFERGADDYSFGCLRKQLKASRDSSLGISSIQMVFWATEIQEIIQIEGIRKFMKSHFMKSQRKSPQVRMENGD